MTITKMRNMFLFVFLQIISVLLIICVCIAILAFIFAIMHSLSNPVMKGVSATDVKQLSSVLLISTILLMLILNLKKRVKR